MRNQRNRQTFCINPSNKIGSTLWQLGSWKIEVLSFLLILGSWAAFKGLCAHILHARSWGKRVGREAVWILEFVAKLRFVTTGQYFGFVL